MGVGGKAIPPHIDKVKSIESDAKFILLVEKDAAFMRLAEDRFYNQVGAAGGNTRRVYLWVYSRGVLCWRLLMNWVGGLA